MNIKPLADRVLILPAPAEEKTIGGIIIPDTAKEKPLKGEVVGTSTLSANGLMFIVTYYILVIHYNINCHPPVLQANR